MNSNELAPLAAAEINHEHELAMQAAESAMDHAVRGAADQAEEALGVR
jgi:hypothetical protein